MSATTPNSNSVANTLQGGCPVNANHNNNSRPVDTNTSMAKSLEGGCPMGHSSADLIKHKQQLQNAQLPTKNNEDLPNICPMEWGLIPSDGRGNSADGEHWENPSPRQLYAALKRKNKADDLEEQGVIDATVVKSVANAHAKCTQLAWDGVLEYEALHKESCSKPALLKFHGNPEFTFKAKFWNLLGYELPFDRHDWYVNRCGREIKYIIDFYSVPHDESAMLVDCRPSITPSGVFDRIKLGITKLIKGQPFSLNSASYPAFNDDKKPSK